MTWGMCVSMRASVRVCGRADAGIRVNSGGQFNLLCNLIDGAGTSTMLAHSGAIIAYGNGRSNYLQQGPRCVCVPVYYIIV